MKPFIQENGRISGQRHSIYDVFDYYKRTKSVNLIAYLLHLSEEEVQVAVDYIEAHYEEVAQRHEAFKHRKNSPEVQAKIEALQPLVEERKREIHRLAAERRNGHAPGSHG